MKTDRNLFLPASNAAKLRQSAWSILQKTNGTILLHDLAQMVGAEYPQTYAAAKHLVRKGLAERVNVPTPAPTKKKPDRVVDKIAVKGIPPWAPGKRSSWA